MNDDIAGPMGEEPPAPRQGRPPSTSRRELECVALRLFTERGFDDTTVDELASEAGVSRRTFFRYFGSKAEALWGTFDQEVATIRQLLAQVPPDVSLMEAIRTSVVTANHYSAADIPELRSRMTLISSVPALQADATLHYAAWEEAVAEFVARRIGQPPWSLYPLAVGRAVLATCRAAYDRWVSRADADLQVYLDAGLTALAGGFDAALLRTEPEPERDTRGT